MVTLQELFPERASHEDWRRYHEFRRARHAEDRPDEPLEPDAVAEDDLTRHDSRRHRRFFTVTARGRLVGMLRTDAVRPGTAEYASNRHLLWAEGWVLGPY